MEKLSVRQQKFTSMVGKLFTYADRQRIGLTMGDAWRSPEEQKRLVAENKSRTLKSKHLDRLAIDLNMFICGTLMEDREDYRILGQYWESLGGEWGGRFGVERKDYKTKVGWDPGHFQAGG